MSTIFVWASNPAGHSISSSFLFWSLCLISAGQGAYNPSLQALGTDQLENDEASLPSTTTKDEQISNTKRSAIPTGGMIATNLVFSCWRRIYASRNDIVVDKKMIMQNLIQSIKAIASKLCSHKITPLQEKPLCVGKNSINIEAKNEEKNPKTENYWMENTKVIVRLLPIWTVLLPFVVIFQQPSTFFMTMQRQIRSSFKVPPATLQSAMTLSIMVSMSLYNKVFIPLTRVIDRNEKGVSVLQRIGIGMVLSVIAMVIAALVETKRLEIGRNTKISYWDNTVISPCLNSIFRMYIDDRRWLERCPDINHCRYRNFNGNFNFRSRNRDGELAIIGLAAAGHPFIWAAVLTNVGTCWLVILNSMLLLRGTDNKKSSTNSRHDHKHGCKTKSRHSPHKHGNCCSGKSDHKVGMLPEKCSSVACCEPVSKTCCGDIHQSKDNGHGKCLENSH
ncbi:hypothetical protein ACFE04_028213 [Oxalis oulophora]